ncbi:MAG: hypothetical protein NZM25_07470 [Leptospiraceae bacterium]|nr:hypothetical protein [Leptospiraceae bacterium]MCX7633774.1 hypothetical protein [Turneriella sp.]
MYAEGTLAITCGGPKIGVKYGDWGFYFGFFPSLVYSEAYRINSSAAKPIRPNLGVGLELNFLRFSVITPIFYMPGDAYYYTLGIA